MTIAIPSTSWLGRYEDADAVSDVFGLTFQIDRLRLGGKVETVELIPNGAEIAVTGENRQEFVRLYTEFILTTSIAPQFEALYVSSAVALWTCEHIHDRHLPSRSSSCDLSLVLPAKTVFNPQVAWVACCVWRASIEVVYSG